jgi:hypothetical protein
VTAPELPRAGQRELEPQGTWRPRSCPGLAAGAGAAGYVVASGWAAGAGVAGHVTASKPTSTRRRGPELQLVWQHVDTRSAPCLDLELVCEGIQSSGYRQLALCILLHLLVTELMGYSQAAEMCTTEQGEPRTNTNPTLFQAATRLRVVDRVS